ncbi:GDP-mannose 4,6-dehydratase [Streptomyces tateyamensis]|uniref:GDP-mannose 4,6-dehydratase n=1 Tax=Streptomyces tateyamensis TaxID=565073 RepID=A0A2V4PEX1_9ACTN|nr:NAD-dependent epimerase/dehydratase family protein [Streptomyces tateyamensis]PYC82170.1 GDP-mannose 4,6-dehydratase [Streptomyces tateyamensis]
MRVVVTGGAGFVGAHLVAALLGRPEVTEVRVVDDFSTGRKTHLAELEVNLFEGSVLDPALLDEALDGAQAVVHLAARPPRRALRGPTGGAAAVRPDRPADVPADHLVNATGTLQVLEAARRAGHLPVVAASAVTDAALGPDAERTPYAVGALAAEGYLTAYQHCYGLRVLTLRLRDVFGPFQPAGPRGPAVVPAFVAAALAGEPLVVHGDGRQRRDFTYVGTVAQVLCAAVLRRLTVPGPVDLACGTRVSVLELAAELGRALGRPLPLVHAEPQAERTRPLPDPGPLRALLPGLRPVPLRVGLERTLAWSRAR